MSYLKFRRSSPVGPAAAFGFALSCVTWLAPSPAGALENTLARTPPMGWNSWNATKGKLNASDAQRIADAIVSSGMKDAGYLYFTIDDCWAETARDGSGSIVPSKSLFPSGMKAVADYVHGKGLKFGMYAASTTITCCGMPGSYNHEKADAQLFASFGADFLKYDWCGVQSGEQGKVSAQDTETRYTTMRDSLQATARPILFSMCEKGQETKMNQADTAKWSVGAGNMWRNTGDISASWTSVLSNFDKQSSALDLQGPGGWNDPDMLEVGNGSLTDAENRSHFALWAVISAPLIAGNDPSKMSATVKGILTNTDVIAIDQDPGGKTGKRVATSGQTEVWSKEMMDGSRGVVMLNRGNASATINVTWEALGISGSSKVRDLWAHADKGSFDSAYSVSVASHDSAALRVYPPGSGATGAGGGGAVGGAGQGAGGNAAAGQAGAAPSTNGGTGGQAEGDSAGLAAGGDSAGSSAAGSTAGGASPTSGGAATTSNGASGAVGTTPSAGASDEASSATPASSGCSCRTASTGRAGAPLLAVLGVSALGLFGARRRKRRSAR